MKESIAIGDNCKSPPGMISIGSFQDENAPHYWCYIQSNFRIAVCKKPCFWHRIWLKLFFGFSWSLVDREE